MSLQPTALAAARKMLCLHSASVCGVVTLALAWFTASDASAEQASAEPANHSIESKAERATPSQASAPTAVEIGEGGCAARRRERERENERKALEPPLVVVTGRLGLGIVTHAESGSQRSGDFFAGIAGSAAVAVSGRTRLGVTGYADAAALRWLAECSGDDCPVSYVGYGIILNQGILLDRSADVSLSLSIGRETSRYEKDDGFEPGGTGTLFSKTGVYVTPAAAIDIWPGKSRRIGLGPYLELPCHGSNGRMGLNVGMEFAVGF